MFYDSEHLKRGGKFGTLWLVATGKLTWPKASPGERRAILNVNIRRTYEDLRRYFPAQAASALSDFSGARYSLYLSGMLAHAIATIHMWQARDALAQSTKCLAPKKREATQKAISSLACDFPCVMTPVSIADEGDFGVLKDEHEAMHSVLTVYEVEDISDEELQAQFLRARNDPNGHHYVNNAAITIREVQPLPDHMDGDRGFGDEGGFGALALEWDTLSSSSAELIGLLIDGQGGEEANLVPDLNIPEAKRPRIEAEPNELPEAELPELQLVPEVDQPDQQQQPEADPRQMSLELEPVLAPQQKRRRRRPCRLIIDEEVVISDTAIFRQMKDYSNIMRQRTLDECAERFTRVDVTTLLGRPSRNHGGELKRLFTQRAITRPTTDESSFPTLEAERRPQVGKVPDLVNEAVEPVSVEMAPTEPLILDAAELPPILPTVDAITSDLEGLRLLQARDGSYAASTSASTSRIDASGSDRSINPPSHPDQVSGRPPFLETVNEVSLEGSISSRVERASRSTIGRASEGALEAQRAAKGHGALKTCRRLDVLEESEAGTAGTAGTVHSALQLEAMEEDLPESASQLLRHENQQELGRSLCEDKLLRRIQQLLAEQAPLTFERLAPIETTDRIMAIETFETLLGLCQQRKINLKQEPCDRPPFNDIFIMLRC